MSIILTEAYTVHMTTTEKSIAELLEDLVDQGWTDAKIGQEMGCSRIAIWNWRTKHGEPSLAKLVRAKCFELLSLPHDAATA